MPRLSGILLPTTTAAVDNVPFSVTGEKLKGDGYYGFSDGLHTVAHFLDGFAGTLEVQGTLAIEPEEADWITLDTRTAGSPLTAGYADALISGAQVGTNVPGIAAATYDFDVTIDGGILQTLSITTAGGEDYDAIAALMNAVVVGGTVAFTSSAFRITSASTGAGSAVIVATGTAGSGGGDLFAAIDLAAAVTTSFLAPVPGTADTSLTENTTYNFTGNYVWIRAVVTDITYGTITKVQLNH